MREGDDCLRRGQGSQAEACFRKILEHEPDHPDALHRAGVVTFLRGDPRGAADLLRRATANRDGDATLYGHFANALMACCDVDAAIASWRRALELAPGFAAAHARLGDAYLSKGDIEASEAGYRKSIELDPGDPRSFVGLSRLLFFENRPAEAEQALRRALELGNGAPEVNILVGTVVLEAGDLDAALELFESAVRGDPDEPRAHASVGLALHWLGRIDEAESAYRRALKLDAANPLALRHLGVLLQERGQLDAAAECFESLLESDPDDDVARHMLAATTGETPPGAPAGYVTRLFDDYADRFDAHLDTIAYRVPDAIRDAVVEVAAPEAGAWRVLDLGCGTGLCGESIRPFAAYLAGVDLAPRMIAKSRERGVYDALDVGSIEEALEGQAESFDLIVAGDVFTYVGDLSSVLPDCAAALRPSGLLAFSVESMDEGDYRLFPTGRYAHSGGYIEATAAASGLSVAYRRALVIREDSGPIQGEIFVLSKMAR